MNANDLNAQWDALSSTLNTYPDLDKKTTAQLNKAISDWQDYYYSDANYDKWLQSDVDKWLTAYTSANKLLSKAVKKQKVTTKEPVVTTPTKVTTLDPLTIFGRIPKKLWLYALGVAGVIGVLIYLDDKDRNRAR